MSLYGGIDLHANNSVIVLLNEQDEVIYQKRLPIAPAPDRRNEGLPVDGLRESTAQTPPTHPCRQWSLKPTGFFWVKL